nr:glycosyltransferase family 4 protein [Frigoribacterium endophyticum]
MTVLTNGLEESVAAAAGTATPRVLGADEPLRLVWVGRLSPEKRPGVLVEAARSFGDRVSVDVYGDGGARRSLERRAGRVTFHGAVPHGEVLTAMRSAHALVSSSWDFDNQPMVVLEAAATGLPVVHCDPDLAEVVPDGGGFLTPTPDAAGLVAAVERLRREPALLTTASEALLRSGSVVRLSAEPLLEVYRSVTRGR